MNAARKHGLNVIADSAESLGAEYNGKKIGGIAPVHIFSFFPNKNISTGEGGMITTNDDELAGKMRIIMNQGQDRRYNHILLGYNYRMTNIQAAVGVEQLKRLHYILAEKDKIAKKYDLAFKNCKNIRGPYIPRYATKHAWYLYTINVDGTNRDEIVRGLDGANIETRLSFPPIHNQPFYKEKFGYDENSLPVSYEAWKKLINIPMWVGLGEKQDYIIEKLKEICEND